MQLFQILGLQIMLFYKLLKNILNFKKNNWPIIKNCSFYYKSRRESKRQLFKL